MTFTKPRIFFLAIPLLAGATVLAQQPGMQQSSSPSQQPQASSALNNPNANPDADTSTPNYADQAFLQDTLKTNETQVQMSKIAQQKASSSDVKDFSQRMIQIHTQLNQQLMPLARQLQVDQIPKPSKQQKKEIAELEQLSGPDFESAYIQDMAKEQAHSLKEFKKVENGPNPNIQKAAKIDEPVLSQHYEILQKIAQNHNVTLTGAE